VKPVAAVKKPVKVAKTAKAPKPAVKKARVAAKRSAKGR
jgi:hypothetical protein